MKKPILSRPKFKQKMYHFFLVKIDTDELSKGIHMTLETRQIGWIWIGFLKI